MDLFFVDYDNTLEDRLLINDGNGFFTDETASRMPAELSNSAFGTAAEIVDMNRDGLRDIIKCSTLDDVINSVRVLYNDGGGHFSRMQHVSTDAPYMMLTGEFNGGSRSDDVFVVTDGQDVFLIYSGNDENGNANFQEIAVSNSPGTTGMGGNIRIADLNGDGFNDVVVADIDTDVPSCDRRMTILRNNGSPFSPRLTDPLNGAPRPWLTSGTFDVAVLDINGDERPDLWCGTCNGNRIFINTTEPGQGEIPTVSSWGVMAMTLLLLAVGSVVFRRFLSIPGATVPRHT
ncbi:MAG: VCBS repeat-containing protein [Planctomycetes bacterium]|nr:VCBS repeat-containing protein [Planctomycetota bacterium]